MPPSLQQMFALARRMGYEMRPIACRAENTRRPPASPRTPGQGYRTPFRPGRDYSKIKCFSCGNIGHMLVAQSQIQHFRSDRKWACSSLHVGPNTIVTRTKGRSEIHIYNSTGGKNLDKK